MKYTARILLLLIAVIIVVMVINYRPSVDINQLPTETNQEEELMTISNEQCFAQEQASEIDEETTLYGYSFLRATINKGQVMGTYENYPAEKDAMYGTFSGVVNMDDMGSTFLTTSYDYSAEGMQTTEEKYFILNGEVAYVGYGQMTDNDQGMYQYEDPTMIDFSYTIPKVSCEKYEEIYSNFSEMRNQR